ncbi:MAG: radical SAM protein [Candidatus Omnitrophica bacterium]|nr:radical SAM protein [Candidatus Omnitrophota bacterium]
MQNNSFDFNLASKIKNKEAGIRDIRNRNGICEGLPAVLTIVDTTRCNLDCIMCVRNKGYLQTALRSFKRYSRRRDETVMNFNLFKKIASEMFPHISRVCLSVAGEPFINPNFPRQLELIESYKVWLDLFTNATLIPKDELLRRLVNRLSRMVVSIDGASKKTYESIRKGARFQEVIDNIKRLNTERMKIDKEIRPKLVFWFVLMRRNIEELPEYVRLAHSLGADGIGAAHVTIFKKSLEKESLVYHKQLANRYLKQARDLIDKLGLETFDFPPLFSQVPVSQDKVDTPMPNSPCKFLWREAVIELNGDVYPCCAPEKTGLLMGNVSKQSFREIWSGKRYQILRASFEDGYLYPPCKNCYQRLKDRTSDNSGIYFFENV